MRRKTGRSPHLTFTYSPEEGALLNAIVKNNADGTVKTHNHAIHEILRRLIRNGKVLLKDIT